MALVVPRDRRTTTPRPPLGRAGGWFPVALLLATIALSSGVAPASGAAGKAVPTQPEASSGIAGWQRIGHYTENTINDGQGLTTVVPPTGNPYFLYRGDSSVPQQLASEGWGHIGDPDSARGYIFDAYQAANPGNSKMYLVTTPSGRTFQYVHTLVSGELYNNSFDAVSPSARFMVSGTWETVHTLQVYRTPLLDPNTPPKGGTLPLAGSIRLDHPVNDIQGCDFVTAEELLCASDDSTRTLFTNDKPLLEVALSRPLHTGKNPAHVTDLGSIPEQSSCSGSFEAEGDDYDPLTGILRVEMIQPGACILQTTVYKYRQATAAP